MYALSLLSECFKRPGIPEGNSQKESCQSQGNDVPAKFKPEGIAIRSIKDAVNHGFVLSKRFRASAR
jgi:hypothetical protein